MSSNSPTMAQVNIRIASDVKRAGDATLERADVTPTQLVRAIWAKLAMGHEALDQLVEALVKDPSPYAATVEGDVRAGDMLVEHIARRQQAFEQEVGLNARACVPLSDDEAEDLLYEEQVLRERERMVWHAE